MRVVLIRLLTVYTKRSYAASKDPQNITELCGSIIQPKLDLSVSEDSAGYLGGLFWFKVSVILKVLSETKTTANPEQLLTHRGDERRRKDDKEYQAANCCR